MIGPRRWLAAAALCAVAIALPATATAQTDYYNTDARRPVRIEDAFPIERHGFELQIAPVRLERSDEGTYAWALEPELAYGVLPRTQLEVGVPLVIADAGEEAEFGSRGVAIALLHNLNTETSSLPAFGLAGHVLVPVGGFAPDAVYPSVKAIATRTFTFARFHLNGEYAFGETPAPSDDVGEASRWMAGIAVDRTFPLRSALLIADIFVEQPLHAGSDRVWTVEAGARYQLDPFFALDAGIGRRLTGEDRSWFLTFGAARAFAIRSLIPVGD